MILESLKRYLAGDVPADTGELHLVFGGPLGNLASLALLAACALFAALYYWRTLHRHSTPARIGLTALRCAVIALVLALLLDPCLVGVQGRPGEQVVALLFDDSRSMNIAGVDGQSRGERLKEAYADHGTAFEEALAKRFQLVRYGLGLGVERLRGVDQLAFGQLTSDLIGGVEGAVRDLAGASVSAVVLFTDGAQQPASDRTPEALAALGTPIFTVGTDTAAPWRDIELSDFSVRRTNFDRSPVEITARIHAEGLDGQEVYVEILDEGRVADARQLTLTGDQADHAVTLDFIPTREGLLTYELRVRHASTGPIDRRIAVGDIAVPDKDRIVQNNARTFLVDNRPQEYRILQLTGSPNWETKFFRRAMEDDKQIKLTSLIRVSRAEKEIVFRPKGSSMNNPLFEGFDEGAIQPRYDEAVFLRMGVERSELVIGYPEQADELFPFDLVIWSDIEHNFFSPLQLEITREFVQKRGGTLLLMGGPQSFAEGGFGGTIIDGMLPVVLQAVRPGSREAASMEPFAVLPTVDGTYSGAWSLDPTTDVNDALWMSMAELHGLNVFSLTRAGATVMARVHASDNTYDGQPFFAIQRYGLGRCAVIATGETWSWRMRVPEDDTRHARLWRQIVRGLVDTAPEPVELRDKADAYTVGAPVSLDVFVRDKRFQPRDGLRATAQITLPGGTLREVPVDESIEETGVYRVAFTPDDPGAHDLAFAALDDHGEVVGRIEERLLVDEDRREYQNARFDTDFLERMARATGGRYVPVDALATLADHIPWKADEATNAEQFRRHLWYWPPFLVLAAILLTVEWYIRRKRGAA